jgi:hypothetical protein|tara:strand:+ start:391 stop:663 length:273 start_codon:yes stop_codon:yes gene_type:complete
MQRFKMNSTIEHWNYASLNQIVDRAVRETWRLVKTKFSYGLKFFSIADRATYCSLYSINVWAWCWVAKINVKQLYVSVQKSTQHLMSSNI